MKPRFPCLLLLLLALPGCVAHERTPKELARRYFAACDARDWDAVWELGSTLYRNLWEESRDLFASDERRDVLFLTPGGGEVFSPEAAAGLTTRELHAAVNEAGTKDQEPPGRPGPGDLEVRVEGDRAEAVWPAENLRLFLIREDGVWRVLALGLPGEQDVLITEGPAGRMCAIWELGRLYWKTRFDGIDLPRLPGDRDVGLADNVFYRLRVESDGRVSVRGRAVAPDDLVNTLVEFADMVRYQDEPDPKPCRARLDLGIDRATPWVDVERVLRAATDFDVRFRDALLWTVETRDFDLRGVPATLASRFSPARKLVRHEPIPLRVSVLRPPTDEELAGLVAAIRARPAEERDAGLRVTLAGDLTAERALRALIALQAATKGPIVPEPSVTGAGAAPALNDEPVAPADAADLFPDEAALALIFEF